ncbi:GNAT family N-acetyltransferase [Nocardia bhagyanarayanae]|uniref:RimJ/RimL family protein N-acetyltransferase n=1 Tax=Nocardia bhagyanarayanae TaxID=1215925 RepID=A0A543FA22_9NOCA|nr:GNAT family N-acetyltransferase [Nocardia bhagyanarayanae]TQM30669.1 RimJ/RimL family protein N-acetyltransferase [Nocardia bhagyanarayanae]
MSSHISTGELSTERLILRRWTLDDVSAVLAGHRLAHWAEDFPADGDRVIAGLFADHPQWYDEYGHRLIVEREAGHVVGSIGLFWPPGADGLEIGYGTVVSRRGRGYASEATRALAEYALGAPGVHKVYANVEPSNPGSVRVLEKAGFRRIGSADGVIRFEATTFAGG